MAHKLKNISEHLQKQIDLCYQHIGRNTLRKLESPSLHIELILHIVHERIGFVNFDADEKRHIETYQNLRYLFETTHIDNMKILKALIYPKDDILPLVDGSTKRRVCFCSVHSFIETSTFFFLLLLSWCLIHRCFGP